MGQFLDRLTNQNSAVMDPKTGQPQFIGTPQQAQQQQQKDAYSIAAQPMGAPQAPGTGSPGTAPPIPKLGTPSFMQAAQTGAPPGAANPLSPGLNKAGKLAVLLTNGLQGAMAGRAANEEAVVQSGGRRSGGVGMGFEAGEAQPWRQAGMAQDYAQKQAQTKLLQEQGEMVPNPYGGPPIPQALAKVMFPALIKGTTAENVQSQKGAQGKDIQGMKNTGALNVAQAHISAEQLKFAIQNGQVARVADGVDENGQPAKIAYNKMGEAMGVLPGALPSSRYLPTETNTVSFQQDANGNILSIPKTSTSQKVMPGAKQPQASGGAASVVSGPGGSSIKAKIPDEVSKAYSSYQDSQSRYNVMQKNYTAATQNNDQQAMLSLLANHLGMTMGLAKGARINQAIISEAEKSRPWLQGMQSKFDKDGYLQGVTLTPQQMDQMVSLGHDRLGEDLRKYQAMRQFYSNQGAPENNTGSNPPAGAKIRDFRDLKPAAQPGA